VPSIALAMSANNCEHFACGSATTGWVMVYPERQEAPAGKAPLVPASGPEKIRAARRAKESKES